MLCRDCLSSAPCACWGNLHKICSSQPVQQHSCQDHESYQWNTCSNSEKLIAAYMGQQCVLHSCRMPDSSNLFITGNFIAATELCGLENWANTSTQVLLSKAHKSFRPTNRPYYHYSQQQGFTLRQGTHQPPSTASVQGAASMHHSPIVDHQSVARLQHQHSSQCSVPVNLAVTQCTCVVKIQWWHIVLVVNKRNCGTSPWREKLAVK